MGDPTAFRCAIIQADEPTLTFILHLNECLEDSDRFVHQKMLDQGAIFVHRHAIPYIRRKVAEREAAHVWEDAEEIQEVMAVVE